MKKTLFAAVLCGLSLLLFSACQKPGENNNTPGGDTPGGDTPATVTKAALKVSVSSGSSELELLTGKSKNLELIVETVGEGVPDATLMLSLKMDATALEAYNAAHAEAPAELLPSAAFQFVSNELMMVKFGKASTSAKIKVKAVDLDFNKVYLLPITIDKVTGSNNWELAENAAALITVSQTFEGPEGGDGSEESPYWISTAEDIEKMSEKLSADEPVYFRMMKDVDMESITDWEPLNNAGANDYGFQIYFDGAGHTISNFTCITDVPYPSFFGVLYGYCHDVTFLNANVVSKAASAPGIIAGYCGTGDKVGKIERVHVQGKVTLEGNKTGVGGMCGTLGNAIIDACSADVDVYSTKNYVGGFFGYSKKAKISNCWSAGSVRGDQRVGGFGGGINGNEDSVINCYSTTKLYVIKEDETKEYAATRSLGGIIGHANQDKGDAADTRTPANVVSGCIAWMDELKTRTYLENPAATDDYYSSGAIVAFGASHNTYEKCYRKADLDFSDYCAAFKLYDQDDSSPTSPLTYQEAFGTHNFPYHGKAAAAGKTVSQIAQEIGWSAEIWDFSEDLPKLRPAPEEEEAE